MTGCERSDCHDNCINTFGFAQRYAIVQPQMGIISSIERDLVRICHQQNFPCAHVMDVRFKSLLC